MAKGWFFENADASTPEAFDRKRALINALAKENLSAAPVGHWTQALSRVLGAAADGYQTAEMNSQEKKAVEENKAALMAAFGLGGASSPAANAGAALPAPQPAPATPPVPRETQPGFAEDGTPMPPVRPSGLGIVPADAPLANRQLMAGASPVLPSASFQLPQQAPAPAPAPAPAGGQPPASLIRSESGGNWQAQNNAMGAGGKPGHFGRLQFGQARLQDAINAGAIPAGTTPQAFMASPELQRRAEQWHFADIDRAIAGGPAAAAIGRAINGVPVTQDGLRAVAHLGGVGGMNKFVQSGGAYNPADANGTTLMAYLARHGGGGQAPAPAAAGSPAPAAAPVAPAGGGMASPQAQALLAALSSPWASRNPMLAQMGAKVLGEQLTGGKLQYQTDGEGNIIALDPTGRRAPTVVYRAAVKPVLLGEGQQLVNPTTGQPIGNAQQTPKISREIEQRKAEAVKMGLDPNDGRTKQFILTGSYPKDPELTSTDKNAILEADEMVSSNRGTITALQRAKELSKDAMGFPGAGVLARVGSLTGNKSSEATLEMNQVVVEQALAGLKSTFGGNPTEGERKILLDIQGSASLPDQVRQKIFDRAIEAANRRMQFNQQRAQQLRGGSFYKPGSAPGAPQAAPAQQQQTQSPAAPAPMLDEARAAIAKGADPEKVKARLREKGIDPGAL